MKSRIFHFLFSVITLFPFFSMGQNSVIDSLNALLPTEKKDTSKIIILCDLSFKLRFVDPELSLKKAEEALILSRKIKFTMGEAKALNSMGLAYNALSNYDKSIEKLEEAISVFNSLKDSTGIAKALHNIGYAYEITGDPGKSIVFYEHSAQISERIKNSSLMAINYNKIGVMNTSLGNYSKGLSWYQKSLTLYENLKDEKGQAAALNSIGQLFILQKNYTSALNYFQKAFKKSTDIRDDEGIAMELNNMGIVFEEMEQADKALEYYLQSLKIKEESGNAQSVVSSYSNIAQIYKKKRDYEKAIEYNEKAMKIDEMLEDKEGMCIDYINIAEVKLLQRNHKDAETLLIKALEISMKAGYNEIRAEVYAGLSDVNAHQDNYKKAYEYHQMYFALKDTMLNEKNLKQINEMQTKYETEKKDKELIKKDAEIEIQQADAKQKSMQRNAFMIGFVLLMSLALFIFRSARQKHKANIIITQQKNEVEKQKHIIEEKNKDITDSINYARRIQTAMLAPVEEIAKTLNSFFILYKPKDIVSGDFYYYAEAGHKIIIAVADCTGHGVPGAFMSMIGNDALNEIILEKKCTQPGEILGKLHDGVRKALKQDTSKTQTADGMDIALCTLDLENNILEYAGALRNLYIARNGNKPEGDPIEEIKANKQSIGGAQSDVKKIFTNNTIQLKKGDAFYMFSDGYADQFGGKEGKKFMIKRMKDILIDIQNKTMPEQESILDNTIEAWKGGTEQVDDILIVGVRI